MQLFYVRLIHFEFCHTAECGARAPPDSMHTSPRARTSQLRPLVEAANNIFAFKYLMQFIVFILTQLLCLYLHPAAHLS